MCPEHELEGLTVDGQHGFLNISITPIECSVVCHTSWAKNVFQPFIGSLPKDVAKTVSISAHPYMVLSIISAGLDAASRVMELSSPLALAGIPIFFITTYYSDFILVPAKEKHNVVETLLHKGFELSENQTNFFNPAAYSHRRNSSNSSTRNVPSPLDSAPPSTVGELEKRTFDLLRKRQAKFITEPELHLVQCSGREVSQMSDMVFNHRPSNSWSVNGAAPRRRLWLDNVDAKLYTCIVSALISKPRFMSVTLAQEDPPSLLIDKTLLPIFGDSLVGDIEGKLIPIFLDLVNLPLEVTGIVCGVAGRLVQDMQPTEMSELSYLSTARAGAVILPEEQSRKALQILEPLLQMEL